MLERQAGSPLPHHIVKLGLCPGRSDQYPRFLLGEYAAGGAQSGDNGLLGEAAAVCAVFYKRISWFVNVHLANSSYMERNVI
jgi:hypothetical protein